MEHFCFCSPVIARYTPWVLVVSFFIAGESVFAVWIPMSVDLPQNYNLSCLNSYFGGRDSMFYLGWRNPPLFWQRSHDAMGGTLLEACVFVLASGNCGCNGRRWFATAATLLLDDWFGGYDKPTPYKWLNSMVYGRCNKLVFMGLINQQTSLRDTILYPLWYLYIGMIIIHELKTKKRTRGFCTLLLHKSDLMWVKQS